MPFEDQDRIARVDGSNMLGHIQRLADQFENAWQLAPTLPLPAAYRDVRRIVIGGMGGSAIGGDLLAALVSRSAPVPVLVVRGYDLPAYINGPETLFIASSFSGNTEETLSATEIALARGASLLAISTGGTLAALAGEHGFPLWQFEYQSQPRAALGWSFGLLVGLAHRLGLAAGLDADLQEGLALVRQHDAVYNPGSPAVENPTKRLAGQLMGTIPVFFGAELFEPLARRWKGQMNENAASWAEWEPLPEANHNAVVGISFPMEHGFRLAMVFIQSDLNHPRVLLRHELTAKMALQHGIMADSFKPQGRSALAQMMHTIQYGDYVSYYLAIGYGEDPTAIPPIVELKEQLAARQG